MKRIDTATRAIDLFGAGKDGYRNGDLVNGIPPTDLNADAMNGPQEEILAVVEAAGFAPNGGDLAQLLKALYKIGGAVTGASRNLRAVLTAANASVTFTADEIVTKAALGGRPLLISAMNKTLNVGTVGAGGMDTGLAPASGWLAIYAIHNPTLGTTALLGVDTTAVTAPEVYGGANMPAGYTSSALISIWPTTAARLLDRARQLDREMYYFKSVLNTSSTGGFTSLSLATAVPRNAIRWKGNGAMSATTVPAGLSFAVCPTVDGQGFPGYVAVQTYVTTVGTVVGGTIPDSPIFTPQTTFYAFSGTAGSSLTINSYGYTF